MRNLPNIVLRSFENVGSGFHSNSETEESLLFHDTSMCLCKHWTDWCEHVSVIVQHTLPWRGAVPWRFLVWNHFCDSVINDTPILSCQEMARWNFTNSVTWWKRRWMALRGGRS